ERLAAIIRAQDRGVARLRHGVRTLREIQPVGIGGIKRQAVDAHQVMVLRPDPIGERNPVRGGCIPAVGAAHVGACVVETLLRRVEHQPADVTTTTDAYAVPRIGNPLRSHRQRCRQAEQQQAAGNQANNVCRFWKAHHFFSKGGPATREGTGCRQMGEDQECRSGPSDSTCGYRSARHAEVCEDRTCQPARYGPDSTRQPATRTRTVSWHAHLVERYCRTRRSLGSPPMIVRWPQGSNMSNRLPAMAWATTTFPKRLVHAHDLLCHETRHMV